MRSPWLTVPNLLTLLRLALVPVFAALHLTGHPGWALLCFLVAAVSDWLDGLAARLLGQQTSLGAFLDPLADKLLADVALLMLVVEREAPLWLLLLVLLRDLTQGLGAAVVRRKGLELPRAPSRVGKYATFALVCMVVLGLVDETLTDAPLIHAWFQVAGYFTGLCVAISTVQYFIRWGYLWTAPPREVGR